MPDRTAVTAPVVSESALLALYLMEMADMGANFALMIHGIDTKTRERILGRFIECGWERDDSPSNYDMRGVRSRTGGRRISLWP
jgi:hypothetical protein